MVMETYFYLITILYLGFFVFSKLPHGFGGETNIISVHFYFVWPHVGLSAKVLSFRGSIV